MSARPVATQSKCFGLAHLLEKHGGFVHGLGRNAAPVEAGAANQLFFNNADLSSQLGGSNGGDITSRSGTQDHGIILRHRTTFMQNGIAPVTEVS